MLLMQRRAFSRHLDQGSDGTAPEGPKLPTPPTPTNVWYFQQTHDVWLKACMCQSPGTFAGVLVDFGRP